MTAPAVVTSRGGRCLLDGIRSKVWCFTRCFARTGKDTGENLSQPVKMTHATHAHAGNPLVGLGLGDC